MFAQGFVDQRHRPLIEIKTIAGKSLWCVVDTGYENEILMDRTTAEDFGVKLSRLYGRASTESERFVRTASGDSAVVSLGSLEIEWDGASRSALIEILQTGGFTAQTHDPYAPPTLFGCGLMKDGCLTIDFVSSVLTIASRGAK